VSFKKGNPGCPCDCGDEPPPPELCGCLPTTLRLTISNADELFYYIGVRAVGEPCNFLEFEGIDAIEGTYEWSISGTGIGSSELVRVAASNNFLEDEFGNKYCLFARIVWSYVGDPTCELILSFQIGIQNLLFSPFVCEELEDFDGFVSQIAFTNDNFNPEFNLCEAQEGTVSLQTYFDLEEECETKFYEFDFTLEYL
jgi:hypothetical protein